jgi:protein-disulfide isomerase
MDLSVPVTARDHILGGKAAGVTLVEYGDYECSYCALAQPIIGQVLTDFAAQLRYVFRHFPLTEIHPQAEGAAEFAELAAKQGKFWEVHEALYANHADLGMPLYVELGRLLGVSERDIAASLESQAFATKINQDLQGGLRSGVDGTPAFFINGQRHGGSYQYEDLRTAIGAALE